MTSGDLGWRQKTGFHAEVTAKCTWLGHGTTGGPVSLKKAHGTQHVRRLGREALNIP